VQVSHNFVPSSAVFDDQNLVSCAGLVPVMRLAEQTGLARLLDEKVRITASRIESGSANPAPKLATLIAGMSAGADCIDDVDVLRSGGMQTLFDGVYGPSTVGTLLREFTFGHTRQLESVLRDHLVALCGRVDLLPVAHDRVFVDIDSLLRPAYGTRAVVAACVRHGAQFSPVMTRNPAIDRAIAAMDETAWTPVSSRFPDALFPVWRYHPFFTNTELPAAKPTSSTVSTRSSKPCSPTSSTGHWPTSPRAASAPTRPGFCAPRSPTICCAPLACWPGIDMPEPADQPCGAASSTSQPA
jgi:hypothetical protein